MSVELVAEACGDRNLMTALGAASVEYGLSGLRGHTNEEAVNLAATAAVGLERALGHDGYPVSDLGVSDLDLDYVCWPGSRLRFADVSGVRPKERPSRPTRQQVLSISDLRKTGNEIPYRVSRIG